MEANDFANELWLCAPQADILMNSGLAIAEAEAFRQYYKFQKKQIPVMHSNPLISLISQYDGSSVEIGGIRFRNSLLERERIWEVGWEEIDPLIIDQFTGEVRIEEANTEGHILWHCAMTGSHFLDALLPTACFLGKCSYDFKLFQDQEAKCKQSEICAELAGGHRYLRFCRSLLGCE